MASLDRPPEVDTRERAPIVVTGARGFVGVHLVRHLLDRGDSLVSSEARLPDRAAFGAELRSAGPQAVVHLAAMTFLPAAERDPGRTIDINVEGTRSVVEALRDADPAGRARMVFVSSGQVYRPAGTAPLDEDSPADPPTAYGRTKLAAELLCRILCEAEPCRPLWVFRPFNHTGPGQRPDFAAPSFARQVALMEAGLAPPVLRTGDLQIRRDFCDVRDVVRAYGMAAAGECPPGTYNLASGRAVLLGEIAEHYRTRSRVAFEVRSQAEPGRTGEVRAMCGSAEKIRLACGWRPEIPLERTLDDLLEEWRSRVAAGSSGAGEGRARTGQER